MAAVITTLYCFVNGEEPTKNTELNVEQTIQKDLKYMKETYKDQFRWYQTGILMDKYLDEEEKPKAIDITNIFQIRTDEKSFDTNVIMFRHTLTVDSREVIDSIKIEEDVPIYEYLVNKKFDEAVKIAKSSTPKIHTKHVILRKHLGPISINPQWTFGNNHGLLFVDADSGQLSYEQPAFRGTGFQTWYGEWPN